jgi:GDPmannose 4,6-dehydratase
VKRALITGITGQDGQFLAPLLRAKGYEVHGLVRRSARPLSQFAERSGVRFHVGDLTDPASLRLAVERSEPDEVYHLAAQSHVKASFEEPEYTIDVTGNGTHRLLRVIRESKIPCRFYQASSSEMFGSSPPPQSEGTPFRPRSPYAIAKVAAFHFTRLYREAHGLFASNGILMNHEGPTRGENFVTRKISIGVARIKLGVDRHLVLGNLEAKRDWGFAGDYVEAMWRILQAETPDDFVIATGEMHSVREFAEEAFAHVGLDYRDFVRTHERFERPAEVDALCGDASKARRVLGWEPKVKFRELVHMMVDHDVELLKRSSMLPAAAEPVDSYSI